MTSYIQSSSSPDETMQLRARYPIIYWVAAWLVLLLLGWLIIGIVYFLHRAIRMGTTEMAVTDSRVVLKQGWISRRTNELELDSIETVAFRQSVLGRIFNYGALTVRGTGEAVIAFPPVQDPVTFRQAIEQARSERARLVIDPTST
jgi:uncharacterized membrane protein YdbT with pleckstrin-like domain